MNESKLALLAVKILCEVLNQDLEDVLGKVILDYLKLWEEKKNE